MGAGYIDSNMRFFIGRQRTWRLLVLKSLGW